MAYLPNPSLPWPIPMEAVGLIAEFEGCRLKAYKCPAGVWTCGWGETDGVGPRTAWDQDYADRRFCDSLTDFSGKVLELCTVDPTANQLGALVSLAYNIGVAGLKGSTVLKAHNRGDHDAAARAFGLWNKARVNGVLTPLKGLTRRRAAESALYLKSDDGAHEVQPQAVEAESKLTASPVLKSGAGAAGVGVVALAQEAGSSVEAVQGVATTVKTFAVDTLGVQTNYVLPIVLIVAGAVVWYWRHKQRQDGWA